jgi:hypothetical protein
MHACITARLSGVKVLPTFSKEKEDDNEPKLFVIAVTIHVMSFL